MLSVAKYRLRLPTTKSYLPCIGVNKLSNQAISKLLWLSETIVGLNKSNSASSLLVISIMALILIPRPLISLDKLKAIKGCLRVKSSTCCKTSVASPLPTKTINCLLPIQEFKSPSTSFNNCTIFWFSL